MQYFENSNNNTQVFALLFYMLVYFKKIVSVFLVLTIVLSSIGLTVVHHICNIENNVYTGIEEIGKQSSCHNDSSIDVCPNCQSQSCCNDKSATTQGLSIENGYKCCSDVKYFGQVEIATNEKSLKKFSERIVFVKKVDYVKEYITKYFAEKVEQIKIKIIDPIRKIIKFIHLLTNLFTPSGEEALL